MKQFLSKDKLSIHTSPLCDILIKSSGYENLDKNIAESNIEFEPQKTYEIASSNFFDFNQHLYEDINHMNSISAGIYCEMALITFRIFIWGAKGEGFEIFKHVLRGEEIDRLKSKEDIKEYIVKYLEELEKGIIETYQLDCMKSFEEFGKSIETRQILLTSILKNLSIENNLKDFRK